MKKMILSLIACFGLSVNATARPAIFHCDSNVSNNSARILTMGARVISVNLTINDHNEHFGVNEIDRFDRYTVVNGERYSMSIDGSLGSASIYEPSDELFSQTLEKLSCYASNSLEPENTVTACSKDINYWGNPSQCMCLNGTKTYNPETGSCQQARFSGLISKSSKLHPLLFTITSYNGLIKTDVKVPLKLIDQVRIFSSRELPGEFAGEYKVVRSGDSFRSDFILTEINIEE